MYDMMIAEVVRIIITIVKLIGNQSFENKINSTKKRLEEQYNSFFN